MMISLRAIPLVVIRTSIAVSPILTETTTAAAHAVHTGVIIALVTSHQR